MLPISAQEIVEVAGLRVRVPNIRTRAGANRDLRSEAINVKSYDEMVAALLACPISDDDRKFVQSIQTKGKADGSEWLQLWGLATSFPETASILASWEYREEMKMAHLIRHHLILDGYSELSPLPLFALDVLTEEQRVAVVDKITELLTPNTRP